MYRIRNPFTWLDQTLGWVPTGRRAMGIFPLGHASGPSMARSVADVLSAHVPRGKTPTSRLDIVQIFKISGFDL